MEYSRIPSYEEGQTVCILLPHQKDKSTEMWQLGQIKKIHWRREKSGQQGIESMKITVYRIREDSVSSQAEWQAHYPGVHLPNEMIILARIEKDMPLIPSERSLWSVTLKVNELSRRVCKATAREFRRRIMNP